MAATVKTVSAAKEPKRTVARTSTRKSSGGIQLASYSDETDESVSDSELRSEHDAIHLDGEASRRQTRDSIQEAADENATTVGGLTRFAFGPVGGLFADYLWPEGQVTPDGILLQLFADAAIPLSNGASHVGEHALHSKADMDAGRSGTAFLRQEVFGKAYLGESEVARNMAGQLDGELGPLIGAESTLARAIPYAGMSPGSETLDRWAAEAAQETAVPYAAWNGKGAAPLIDEIIMEALSFGVGAVGNRLRAPAAAHFAQYIDDPLQTAVYQSRETMYSVRRIDTQCLEVKSYDWLKDFGNLLADDKRALSMYRKATDRGVTTYLDFGPRQFDELGQPIKGMYSRPNSINILAREHKTVAGMLDTFRHEGRHFLDDVAGLDRNSAYFEYRGWVEDFMSEKGRTPSRSEMGVLARDVESLYPQLKVDERFRRITGYIND